MSMREDVRRVLFSRGGFLPAVTLDEQWSGLRPWVGYNWRDFTVVKLQWEWDNMMGNFEVEIALVGLSATLVWTWATDYKTELDARFDSPMPSDTPATKRRKCKRNPIINWTRHLMG